MVIFLLLFRISMSRVGFEPRVGGDTAFKVCEATALTNQTPWLDQLSLKF